MNEFIVFSLFWGVCGWVVDMWLWWIIERTGGLGSGQVAVVGFSTFNNLFLC